MKNDAKIQALTKELNCSLADLCFEEPIFCTYNPLEYASAVYFEYWNKYGAGPKKIVFMGMNPGPFGMAQTGIPFGEVSMVRDWMRLEGKISKPLTEHPKRPIMGFDCTRSEVSGKRLWSLFSDKYPLAKDFFAKHFVLNYCPLVFMSKSGANITPDKLRLDVRTKLQNLCDLYILECLCMLRPKAIVGVGDFAFRRLLAIKDQGELDCRVHKILHPSPASPAANHNWAETVTSSLKRDTLVL
jgi:single-strand selective monofunctional uracil DNA glycosylase